MRNNSGQYLLLILALWCFSNASHALSFTPEEGTTIASSTVTVEWTSDAKFQWIRAFDGGGARVYDSGLNRRQQGAASFFLAATDTTLQIVFYESDDRVEWTTEARNYAVQIGRVAAAGSANTLSNLSCPDGNVAKFVGGGWRCANDEALGVREVHRAVAATLCGPNERLTRNINGTVRCASDFPECLANYADLPADARSIWDSATGSATPWSTLEDSDAVCQVSSPSGAERYTFTSQGVMYFQTIGADGSAQTIHEAYPEIRSLALIRNCLPVLPCENTGAFP